jgi:hypothetical protein
MNTPAAVDVDGFGNLYIADSDNGTLRKVEAEETSLSFADTNVGQTSATQTVTIRNAGAANLDFSDATFDNNAFATVGGTCGSTPVAPGSSCTAELAFTPNAAGKITGTATITTNAANSPHLATLSGTGVGVAVSTSTALATSPANQADVGSTVTLTAVVSAESGTPTGSVSFLDGETTLGTSSLSNGTAVLEISSLAEGQHSLTAHYLGNEGFLESTSNAVGLTLAQPSQDTPDYTLTASPSSLTIPRGQSGQATITLTPLHGFTGTVTLSCGSLPIGMT